MDLKTFNNWRNEVHNKEKKRIRKIAQGIATGTVVFLILAFTSLNGDKVDYTVKVNGNKVDSVHYVDDEMVNNEVELSAFFQKEEKEYIVQAESYENFKELEKISETLEKEGVNNSIFVENNLIKIQIKKSFNTREEAEEFAYLLNEKGLIKDFTVRVK